MIERDKLRAKIIAVAKNKESRSNYNSLFRHTKRYDELTTELRNLGKKVSITSDLLKYDYWKDRYKAFNSNNPNVIIPEDNEYYIIHNNDVLYHFTGTETEYNKVMQFLDSLKPVIKGKITIKKL